MHEMYGIAGVVGISFNDDIIQKMRSAISDPNLVKVFQTNDCCMLQSGSLMNNNQPFVLSWGGETYTIVYNGEIYNADEIRSLLKVNGHEFNFLDDSELVLHAFSHWQEGCVERLDGNFAFAIWSHKRKKIFLARDRMGVKPLYYKLHNGGIIFASEIKTILAHPNVPSQIDSESVAQIILIGPGHIPGSVAFKGIKELEPGCYGYYQCKKWHWQRYWKLRDRDHTDTFGETAQKVRVLLLDSIKRQTESCESIGTLLSGGLDSSIISSVCASELRNRGERLSTFSVNYKDHEKYFVPGRFQPTSDNDYIYLMQDYLQADHHWTVLTPEELINTLRKVTLARELPGMADIDSSLFLFCKDIKKHTKIALSGECADEIFGGYPWYRDPAIRQQDGFPWSQNILYRASFLNDCFTAAINPVDYVHDLYTSAIAQCDIRPGATDDERKLKELVNLNQNWFMQTLLERNNRMSMIHGLTIRVPFCDYRIAEYLYSVPWEYKEYNGQEKGLLRYAMSDYLPESVLGRKKSPYPKTHDPLYFELVCGALKDLLDKKDAPIFALIKKKSLERLLLNDEPCPWYGQLMRTPQTIAYMLQINMWLEAYNVNIV